MSSDDPQTESWHFDRRIPIALILTLLAQGFVGVWWLSSVEFRVTEHQKQLESIERELDADNKDGMAVESRVIRIEEKIVSQTSILQNIEKKLDKMNGN